MQPYETREYNNRNKPRNQRSDRRQEETLRFALENTRLTCSFPRYFLVKFPRMNIERDLDNIATQRDIKRKIGDYEGAIKKHSQDTLLIQVKSAQQGNRLRQVERLAGVEVDISEHRALNQCKGTVLSRTMSNTPLETLKEALKDQNVIEVERMKARINGELQETHRYILTFNQPNPPTAIKLADWHHEAVDLYIPKPMRCVKCWKFGHTQKRCRRENPVCLQCAEDGHLAARCTRETKCANCYGKHRATDRNCPVLHFKSEVLATQTRLKYTYHEAEEDVKERFQASGRPHSFPRPRPNQIIDSESNIAQARRRASQMQSQGQPVDQLAPRSTGPGAETDGEEATQGALDNQNGEDDADEAPTSSATTIHRILEQKEPPSQPKNPETTETLGPEVSLQSNAQQDRDRGTTSQVQKDHAKTTQNQETKDKNAVTEKNNLGAIPKIRIRTSSGDEVESGNSTTRSLNLSDISIPAENEDSDPSESNNSSQNDEKVVGECHYDPWLDQEVPGPRPQIETGSPPGKVATIVDKIETNKGLKTATEFYKNKHIETKKDKKKNSTKLTKRQRKSAERAQKRKDRESPPQPIPVIGSNPNHTPTNKKFKFKHI